MEETPKIVVEIVSRITEAAELRRGGVDSSLTVAGRFQWKSAEAQVSGLIQRLGLDEHVTVLRGDVDDAHVRPNPAEVSAWEWVDLPWLERDFEEHPERYAPWLRLGFEVLKRAS